MPAWFDELLHAISKLDLADLQADDAPTASAKLEPKALLSSSLEWVKCALDLGHIEPSQPMVGALIGWPQRLMLRESLYADFVAWRARFHPKIPLDHKSDFYKICDLVFLREENRYRFPPVDECRKRFDLACIDKIKTGQVQKRREQQSDGEQF